MSELLSGCRLLILDVDGVLTDGTKMYDRDGRVFGKSFNDRDFTAIRRFEDAGVRVCLLSADRRVTLPIAKKRGIDFYYARKPDGSIDKVAFVAKFEQVYGITRDAFAYVGDDLGDLPIIEAVPLSFCPATAPKIVRDAVTQVLQRAGGDGLVDELYELHESIRAGARIS